jgi:hypothetical protein
VQLPPEDPAAQALDHLVRSRRPLTGGLAAAGVSFVIVDAGLGATTAARAGQDVRAGQHVRAGRLAGCVVAFAAPGLVVYRVK